MEGTRTGKTFGVADGAWSDGPLAIDAYYRAPLNPTAKLVINSGRVVIERSLPLLDVQAPGADRVVEAELRQRWGRIVAERVQDGRSYTVGLQSMSRRINDACFCVTYRLEGLILLTRPEEAQVGELVHDLAFRELPRGRMELLLPGARLVHPCGKTFAWSRWGWQCLEA